VPLPHEPGPHWGEVGIHGLARPREWDALVTVGVDGLTGEAASFVFLQDETVIPESGLCGGLEPLARALAAELPPPFRARAVRRSDSLWAVAGRRIETIVLADDPGGDFVELTWDGRERFVRVDGAPSLVEALELERIAASRYPTFAARASRLHGHTWELDVDPL
jgi:hypothetical protein